MKTEAHNEENLTKVVFHLEESDWHDHGTESTWVLPLNDGTYQIENVPYYVYGISYGDVVSAKREDAFLVFDSVVERSGHSTYRIFLATPEAENGFESNWEPLAKLGCTYERATDYLIAVDVPPTSDIFAVYAALEAGEKLEYWDFEEGHCGHAVK